MKNRKQTVWIMALLLLAALALSACDRGGGSAGPTPTPTECECTLEGPAAGTATPQLQSRGAGLSQPSSPETPDQTVTGAAAARPPLSSPQPAAETPAPRLDPQDWREWPVVPDQISDELRAVYQRGLAAGNRADRFSKIGDCQSIKEAMMGFYDLPGRYRLPESKPYLTEAIAQFQGSFNRDGQGVKGGYNAAAVLSPMWADPQVCQPGETPLECELRDFRPSIALISLEVWWDGRTPDRYVTYMRRIIEHSLEKGVVPVLSTKADNVEGDHAINLATARLAAEYGLPLWNFWAAVQPLPHHGLDPTRPDGFHISYDAWNVRSRTALEAVDAVWRMLNEKDVPAGQVESAPTARPSATALPRRLISNRPLSPQAAAGLAAPAEEPALLLEISERAGEQTRLAGIYRLPLGASDQPETARAGESGLRLLGSAPNGDFLAAVGSDLWLVVDAGQDQPAEWFQISAGLLPGGGAYFLADLSAVVALQAEGGLSLLPLEGGQAVELDTGRQRPAGLLPAPSAERVFWWTPAGGQAEVYASPLDGGEAEHIGAFTRPSISPDGRWLAHWDAPQGDNEILLLRSLRDGAQRKLTLPAGLYADAAWSPDGSTLAVALAHRSDYSGRVFGSEVALVDAVGLSVRRLVEQEGVSPRLLFSPDGKTLYRAATLGDSDGYRLSLLAVSLPGGRAAELPLDLRSEDYLWISAWAR